MIFKRRKAKENLPLFRTELEELNPLRLSFKRRCLIQVTLIEARGAAESFSSAQCESPLNAN